ncbi:MAG: threonine--tRNA ligase, partial [Patescibacteria group bacterium]
MENEKLFAMRHSCAHVLAAAVQRLYPEAKFGVGPVVENGFYYDIMLPEPISEDRLPKIEKEMKKIVSQSHEMVREEMSIDEAIKKFSSMKQDFKVELLKDLKEKGTTKINAEEARDLDIAKPDVASTYTTGNFIDLCRGPHVANIKEIGAFKLTKVAGAYWRGDEKNAQLQRIYGVCFEDQKELDDYLKMLEEAKKRD